jgi:hypothetical protein
VVSVSDETDQDEDTIRINPRLSASLSRTGPRLSLDGTASVIPQFRSDREFDSVFAENPDTGALELRTEARDVNALEINSRANLGASYLLTPRSTATGNVFVSRRDFSSGGDTLEPSMTVGAGAGLTQALDRRTSLSVGLTARRFTSDNEDTDSLSLNLGGSRQLTANTNLQLGVVGIQEDGDINYGFTGNLGGRYQAQGATFNAGLRQLVDQDEDGVFQAVTALTAGVDYPVNARNSFGASAGYTRSTPFDGGADTSTTDTFTLGARYTYQLSSDWQLQLNYGLRFQNDDDDDDSGISNRFTLNIARNFDF